MCFNTFLNLEIKLTDLLTFLDIMFSKNVGMIVLIICFLMSTSVKVEVIKISEV